jgi:hypothetical protein
MELYQQGWQLNQSASTHSSINKTCQEGENRE